MSTYLSKTSFSELLGSLYYIKILIKILKGLPNVLEKFSQGFQNLSKFLKYTFLGLFLV